MAAYGQTEHTRGLLAALRLKPEVIFLLTDAGDPAMKPGDFGTVRQATRGRTSIHCLHFGRGKPPEGENFMMRLAAENRGSYTYVDMDGR
jgi:Ca-activated chloride channel family protein